MERVNNIYNHPLFKEAMTAIKSKEKERRFCKHGIEHMLDVARISTIISIDECADISRDVIYAAALLHDIGRYVSDCDHAEQSAKLCSSILPDCGYNEPEISIIVNAVAQHSKEANGNSDLLADILYRADKMSRICRECNVSELCKWESINTEITL